MEKSFKVLGWTSSEMLANVLQEMNTKSGSSFMICFQSSGSFIQILT